LPWLIAALPAVCVPCDPAISTDPGIVEAGPVDTGEHVGAAVILQAIAREVREETGLTVKGGRLLKVRSGFRYRIEVYYEAVLVGGLDGLNLDAKEVLEARLFSLSDLPAGMPEAHRELAATL
jgi:8-oxo-dGTP pyrophosphatase MutT (NUDIX family)